MTATDKVYNFLPCHPPGKRWDVHFVRRGEPAGFFGYFDSEQEAMDYCRLHARLNGARFAWRGVELHGPVEDREHYKSRLFAK